MGEVTPGPPLLQAGLLSSALGEAAGSLLGATTGVDGKIELRLEVGTPALLLEGRLPLVICCSDRPRLSFPSAGTGMAGVLL